MRRVASCPAPTARGCSALGGHQTTTGVSASSSGSTTASACRPARREAHHHGLAGPSRRRRTSASRPLNGCSGCGMTTRMRDGCARRPRGPPAARSSGGRSSVSMTRVSTAPVVAGARLLADVDQGGGDLRRRRGVQVLDHGLRQLRPSFASISSALAGPHVPRVLLRRAMRRPVLLDRVETSQPSSTSSTRGTAARRRAARPAAAARRPRRGLRERLCRRRVHVHVAHLHRGAPGPSEADRTVRPRPAGPG